MCSAKLHYEGKEKMVRDFMILYRKVENFDMLFNCCNCYSTIAISCDNFCPYAWHTWSF